MPKSSVLLLESGPCPSARKTISLTGPLIKELFSLYLTGEHSIRSLHATMVARGLTSARGNPVSKHTVELILSNPFYCGLMRNGRTGEIFEGKHEPMISIAGFDRIQDIKAGRFTKKATRRCHAYRRLFCCARCGKALTGERQKGHVYYRCHTPDCIPASLREDIVDRALHDLMTGLALRAKVHGRARVQISEWDIAQQRHASLQSIDLRIVTA